MKFLRAIILSLLFVVLLPVAPTSALPSEDIVILQAQAFGNGLGPDSSYEEFILLYNSSAVDVNVTDWCVEYVSSTGSTTTELECIDPPNPSTELWLESGGLISFATAEFAVANPGFVPDFTFTRKLSNSSGHIRLVDNDLDQKDLVAWGNVTSAEFVQLEDESTGIHFSGEVMSRDLLAENLDTDDNSTDFDSALILSSIVSGLYEIELEIDLCPNIDEVQLELPISFLQDEAGDCYVDFCPNIDGLQIEAPERYYKPEGEEDCILEPLENSTLFITELLPNPESYDTDQEFIEIYNPNDEVISLVGYRLQLGPSFSKEFEFTAGAIAPGEYVVFSDAVTSITLPNTSAASVRLIAPAGNLVSETGVYSNANDDVSWALVEDIWIYTNQITLGAANKPYLQPAIDEVLGVTSVLAPCSAGKFRNPATNRCKSFETAVSQLTSCDADEFRNPETNRCKKLTTSSALAACPEGQERNPETNRCRKVATLGSTTELAEVTDIVVESGEGQLNWPIIMASIGGTIGYMIYEWRNELSYRFRRMRA